MHQAVSLPTPVTRDGRFVALWAALAGAMATGGLYALLTLPLFRSTFRAGLFTGQPIEACTLGLFFWCMATLAWRVYRLVHERRALDRRAWGLRPGRAVSVAELKKSLSAPGATTAASANSWLGRRIRLALTYLQQHDGSSDALEQRLGVLADRDARDLELTHELVRSLAWGIPILGFLGTVAVMRTVIFQAGGNLASTSLTDLLGVLPLVWDPMALASVLWVVVLLARTLVLHADYAVLSRVHAVVQDTLVNCLEKRTPETQALIGMVDGVTRVVLQATRDAWREQGQLWSRTVEQIGESQIAALQTAVQKLVEQLGQIAGAQHQQFQQHLAGLESLRQLNQKASAEFAARMAAHQAAGQRQVDLLAQLVAGEGRITNLQRTLNENLAALNNVQQLDQAIHSLTAAAHLLTVRSGSSGRLTRMNGNESTSGEAA